jgi:hypothetical protein
MSTKKEATITADLFPEPDSNNSSDRLAINRKATPKPARPTHVKSNLPARQDFLPGLSRRGRPRLETPISPSVRATESRKKRIIAGAKRIELILDPDIAAKFDTLAEYFSESRVELLSRLITNAARKITKPAQKANHIIEPVTKITKSSP